MTLTIDTIKPNQYFQHEGDVHVTGNIGAGAVVIIKSGSLIVGGHVKERAEICLTTAPLILKSPALPLFADSTPISKKPSLYVQIQGSLGHSTQIKAESGVVSVGGPIGENVVLNTMRGDIQAQSVGDYAILFTGCGKISVGRVGSYTQLKTLRGDIDTDEVNRYSTLKTMSGNVTTGLIDPTATVKAMQGSIYASGIRHGTTIPITAHDKMPETAPFFFSTYAKKIVAGRTVYYVSGSDALDSSYSGAATSYKSS